MTTRGEAIAAGGQLLAVMNAEREALAAAEGPRAVALAAWFRGHERSVEEIEQQYEAMQDEARPRRE